MALLPEQLRELLTPEGIGAAFGLLGAELERVLNLAPVLDVLNEHERKAKSPEALERALVQAFEEIAAPWATAGERVLALAVAPVVAAALDALERDYAVDALDDVREIAKVTALAVRGVTRQTKASTPKLGKDLAVGVVRMVVGASPTRLDLEGYVRGRMGNQAKVIAAAYLGRARSAAMVGAMASAGITKLRFLAVMDAATTEICQYMHNRVMNVSAALDVLDKAANAPDREALAAMPWVYRRENQLVIGSPTSERIVTTIADRRGSGLARFEGGMSTDDLEHEGLVLPPLHGYCRSIAVPES